MNSDQTLYDSDFLEWTKVQSDRLRHAAGAGVNYPLDWENIAEEIEDMGKSQVNALESRILTIIEHLLKLQCSPAAEPRNDWQLTILRSRLEIAKLLKESPSLKRRIDRAVRSEMAGGRRLAALALAKYGESLSAEAPDYTADQVLGDWFPDPPRAGP